jgi:tRNA(Ile)-lysidine synthase
MGSLKKPEAGNLLARTQFFLRSRIRSGERFCIGLSGGLDSIVLLDVLCRSREALGYALSALHVNHQLSPHAGGWAEFCHHICHGYGVRCHIERVVVAREGRGLEASARAARYEALSRQPADCIALAHHLDDQAETVLLQLLRGAGMKGLGAMPAERSSRSGQRILRPFLDVPRSVLEAYAGLHGLVWIEDESNWSLDFDRNFLRHEVLPALARRFPGYRTAFARGARHAAEAAALLEELARTDLTSAQRGDGLRVTALQAMAPARAKNALRHFFMARNLPVPDADQLDEILSQAIDGRRDARAEIRWAGYALRRDGDVVVVTDAPPAPPIEDTVAWRGEAALAVPGVPGEVCFENTTGQGISLSKLRSQPMLLRRRRGGERMRLAANRPRRTLKNLLQEHRVPHWERARMPLLFCGETMVWVPGVGVDVDFQASAAEASLAVSWRRHGALAR